MTTKLISCPSCGKKTKSHLIEFFGHCDACNRVRPRTVNASKEVLDNLSRSLFYRKIRGKALR